MNELKIHGHSGCGLKVVEDSDGKLLVEKSCAESYVPRLKAQFMKQHEAAIAAISSRVAFDTPYPSWTSSNTMLMPYVNAMSFVEFMERASKADIDNLIENLKALIDTEVKHSKMTAVPTKKIMDKVKSVYENAQKNPLLTPKDIETVEKACTYVISYLMKRGESLDMYVGICHGDLTFSNILFKNSGRHALIDYLDSFIETPLQDLVKIRQDSAYYWSLMMTDQTYNEAHVKTVMKYIDDKISKSFGAVFMEHYDMLQFVNILRIVPYVKDHKVFERLVEILETINLESK